MTSPSKNNPTAHELEELSAKRQALESLISIGVGIQNHQRALEELSVLARPSQRVPPRMAQLIGQLETRFTGADDSELSKRLNAIDGVTSQNLERVVGLVMVEPVDLRDGEVQSLSVSSFLEAINEFKRRTQTSLALRYVLTKRGVTVPTFKLPFPQESIAQKIELLRDKEQRCLDRIRTEVRAIIADTEKWLRNDHYPEKMKDEIRSVQHAMQANLEHLDRGGSIAELPHQFEVVSLDGPNETQADSAAEPASSSPEEASAGEAAQETAPPPANAAGPKESKVLASDKATDAASPEAVTRPPAPRKRSTLWLFMKWLSTPWNTSWKEIKERYNGK